MTTRDRIVVLVLVAVAAIAAFWFMVFSPKRSEAAKLGADLAQVRQQEDAARTDIAAGMAAQSRFRRNYSVIAKLGEAVPADSNEPSLVYQLDTAAHRAGVDFRSLKLSQQGGAGSPAPAAATPAPSAGAKPAAGAATPATQASSATLPPGAAVGPAGFPTMPFELGFDGNFFKMSDFFRRLDAFVNVSSNRLAVSGRLLTINGLSLTAGRHGFPSVSASVSANAYLVPATEGTSAGATPSGPGGTTGTTPSSGSPSGTSSSTPATATAPTR